MLGSILKRKTGLNNAAYCLTLVTHKVNIKCAVQYFIISAELKTKCVGTAIDKSGSISTIFHDKQV